MDHETNLFPFVAIMPNPLDNMMWSSLSGTLRHLSVGTDTVRRFAPGFSPLLGFADLHNPDLSALVPFCEPGEQFYCEGWSGPVPDGWQLITEATMVRMVWAGTPDAVAIDVGANLVAMNATHVARAMELAQLTKPGPFGPRTIELGDYFACFEGDRLMAMAGERMHSGQYREVSGVCTHPDFEGRGLARALMTKIVRLQLQRQQIPFLQVMSTNLRARKMYERLGFKDYREIEVRIITRN